MMLRGSDSFPHVNTLDLSGHAGNDHLPTSLRLLKNLTELDLTYNKDDGYGIDLNVDDIPDYIVEFPSLKTLSITCGEFSSLPESIGKMNLIELNIDSWPNGGLEAINPAIPLFDKTHPYDQMPFQYSLHKIPKPGARLQHTEFLHADKTNPIPTLVKQLTHDIGQTGTIIVWNQSFEKRCNRYMGKMYPRYKSQLESINLRVFDLMGIFKEKYIDY